MSTQNWIVNMKENTPTSTLPIVSPRPVVTVVVGGVVLVIVLVLILHVELVHASAYELKEEHGV